MTDSYTSSLRIAQQTVGGNENTWGTILNSSLAMLDTAIAGIVSVSVTGGNVTLSTANNADDQARNALFILTGTPGATRTITFPDVEKLSWVFNNSDSSATLTAGAGTTVTLRAGYFALIYADGATNAKAIINTGDLVAGVLDISAATGGQIKFPATQNASANANTLDDYEEGTWTPGIAFGGASVGITYTTQAGIYRKIGDTVWYHASITLSNKGSSSGSAFLTGLPFTIGATANVVASARYDLIDLNVAGGFYSPQVQGSVGSTTLILSEQGDNVSTALLTDADFQNTSIIRVSGFYTL